MTSVGHFSLASETLNNPSVAAFFITLVGDQPNGFTPQEFCQLWNTKQIGERHPRFHVTVDKKNNNKFDTDNNTHAEMHHVHVSESIFPKVYRKDIQARVEQLQTDPLNVKEKLWEVKIAPKGPLGTSGGITTKVAQQLQEKNSNLIESILFFRGHHVLGDGVSLTTTIMDLCDESEEFHKMVQKAFKGRTGKSKLSLVKKLQRQLKRLIFFWIGVIKSLIYQTKLFWGTFTESNPFKELHKWAEYHEEVVDSPKRSISWSMAAPVDQVKWVAQTLAGKKATINDIFVSCVSAAIIRQLEDHRARVAIVNDRDNQAQQQRQRKQGNISRMKHMNIVIPVHLNGGVIPPGQSLSNRIGAMVARVPGEDAGDSANRLAEVHDSLYELKQTPTPLLSYLLVRLVSSTSGYLLPNKVTQYLFSKANAGAAAVVTNVRGSPHPIHINGRKVQSLHGFVPCPPGVPIGVVVSSYAGNVSLTLSAEPWAVPDGNLFLSYVLEEYKSLLAQAVRKATS